MMKFNEIFSIPGDARLDRLRKLYRDSPMGRSEKRMFYYSGDRWLTLSFLEGWERYQNEPTTVLRRAKAEAHVLDESRPLIDPEEVLVGRPDFEPYTEAQQARFDELAKSLPMMPNISRKGRTDHLALDYGKLLRLGVQGLLDEIAERRAALSLEDGQTYAENLAKLEFYEGCQVELEALLRLAERYAAHARELAQACPKHAENLMQVAQTLDRVPRYPARTFREAIQSVHFYTFCLFGLYAAGRPDRYLLPYYEADRAAGTLTLEQAQLMVDQYCMLMNTFVFSSAAVSVMVGGSDREGRPVENELTAMFLNSIPHTRMAEPSIGLCVADPEHSELMRRAVMIIAQGLPHPTLYNDRAIIQSLKAYGVRQEDADDYINTTCVEISVSGKTNAWTTCPWINLAQLFLDTLAADEYKSMDALFAAFTNVVHQHVRRENDLMSMLQMERERNGAMPLRVSCLVDDCLARGRSLAQGGARYNPVFPTFVGLANVVDGLAAMQQLIYDEKRLSYRELMDALDADFAGNETLRRTLLYRTPHYGNDTEAADSWAVRVTEMLKQSCAKLHTYRGSRVVPAIFSFSHHAVLGARTGATPDGRKAGLPLASCCGAGQGRDVNGPTASLLSATCWDTAAFIGGIALNLRFSKDIMRSRDGENVCALLNTFFARDGIQVQINVANTEQLKEAKAHPEEHGDLLVRVGGYSDYFVRLPEKLQDEIMARTEHMG